jgi:hypothetical protein
MCLEGRVAALLVALTLVLPRVADGRRLAVDPARPREGARVTVTLATANRQRLTNAAVVMRLETDPARERPPDDVAILADGSFVFSNVQPGAYRIHARAGTDSRTGPLLALYRSVVDTRDVSVTLTLLPGASVSGRLVADASKKVPPATFSGLRVHAPPADGSDVGDAAEADVSRDGSFTITGVSPGRHVLVVEGLRDPWLVQRVIHRGQDISDTGVEADSGQAIGDIRMTLTDAATEVSGTVRDAAGHAVSGATVLIIPAAPEFWTRVSRRFGRTVSDAGGRYRYRGLPPGDYRVVASRLDAQDVYQPELLRQLSAAGVPLSLGPLGTPVIDLGLTLPAIPQRTSAR